MVFGVELVLHVNDDAQNKDGNFLAAMALAIIPPILSLHHILRLWPRRRWSVRSDFIYCVIELGIVTGYIIAESILLKEDSAAVIGIVAAWILWLLIMTSFALTFWNLHASHYRAFGSTYDFTENYDTVNQGKSRISRWSLLVGVYICRRRFGIDRTFVRGLRGGISILCLLGMLIFGYVILSTQPITPQVFLQTMEAEGYNYSGENVSVEVSVALGEHLPRHLVDLDVSWQPETLHVPCDTYRTLASCNVYSPFSSFSPDSLTISVNYTCALKRYSIPSLRSGVYLYFLSESGVPPVPIQLFPGFHLFGTTYYSYRDTYASPRDLTLGIPRFVRELVVNIQALIPDPEFPNANSNNTTATLRLTYQGGSEVVQETYMVQREQPGSTIFNSFALLGGIWTFINGAFAMIFGCSLLLVLFGIKPLSIYGLVHLFQRRRPRIDSGYTLSAEEQSRTIAILREHLLDNDEDIEASENSGEKDQDGGRIDGGNTLSTKEQSQASDMLREHLLDDGDSNGKVDKTSGEQNQDVRHHNTA